MNRQSMKPSTLLFLLCGVLLTCSAIARADATSVVVGGLFLVGTILTGVNR